MIKFEHTEVLGVNHAIRGMRNPMNSWNRSDSGYLSVQIDENGESYVPNPYIGEKDLALMLKLAAAGTDHAKYRRMITVYVDILAPLYWWKEFDTYKVGTVANSCSTMHKIADKEFTLEDFSCEHLFVGYLEHMKKTVAELNNARNAYLNGVEEAFYPAKGKAFWWQMIQLLPSSYNQKRTVMMNYEVLANIYHSRRNHKLDEWHGFCEWIENGLPYHQIITGESL